MSWMIEVYLPEPEEPSEERRVVELAQAAGGELTFREARGNTGVARGVCLTIEFPEESSASGAADAIRGLGLHVEGPGEY